MKKNSIIFTALCIFALSGCNKKETSTFSGKFGEPTEAIITLSSPVTRGPSGTEAGTAEENDIKSLEFYIFDDTGNGLDPAVGTGNGYFKIDNPTGLRHKIKLSAGVDKKIVVVSNINLGAPDATMNTYDKLVEKLSSDEFKAALGGNDHNSRDIPVTGLEMSGFATTATVIANKTDNVISITISRLVSKIEAPVFDVNAPVALSQAQIEEVWGASTVLDPATDTTFTFKAYAVINGVTKSTVCFTGRADGNYKDPMTLPWNTWVGIRTYLNSSFNGSGDYENNYSGKQSGEWFLDGTNTENGHRVYVYENKPTDDTYNSIEGYTPESVYAYIIKGELTATLDGKGVVTETRYWRVNLIASDTYHIMRNCVYKVAINKITTPGYATPQEAEENEPIVPKPNETAADFTITVADWDINSYTTQM